MHILSNDWIRPPKFGIIVDDVSKPKTIALNMIAPIMKLRTCVLSMKLVSLIIVQLFLGVAVFCMQLIRLDSNASSRFREI